jgi:branched-chain amino acid transport system permease protein
VSPRERVAAIVVTLVFLALFLLLYVIAPGLADTERELIRWLLPEAAINEALIWTLAACGLHIALDRTRSPDLGAAAYWAMGGYLTGVLMSPLWGGGNFRFLTAAPTWNRGVHLSFWIVLLIAGALCALLAWTIAKVFDRQSLALFALVTLGMSLLLPRLLADRLPNIGPIDPIGVAGRAISAYDLRSRYVVYVALLAVGVFISLRMRNKEARKQDLPSGSAIAAAIGGVVGVLLVSHSNAVVTEHFGLAALALTLAIVLVANGNIWSIVIFGPVISWIYSSGLVHLGEGVGETGTSPAQPGALRWGFLLLMVLAGLASRRSSAGRRSKQTGNT